MQGFMEEVALEMALETGCLWVTEGWRWVVAAEICPPGLLDHSCRLCPVLGGLGPWLPSQHAPASGHSV